MAFTPQFLDEIRTRLACSEVIGRRVRLVKKGREHSGLCPFHNEKTPSFTVNDDKGFFHCFGCGAHGDVIGFTMRIDNLSFPEAVEALAGEAGLEVPRFTSAERDQAKRQKTLREVVEAACQWFEKQLRSPSGKVGYEYFINRGLDDATISRFRLGYAPDARDALRRALTTSGIEEKLLVEAGLIVRPEDGRDSFDFFRGRVIFPIMDGRGQVVAFGGRILGDGQPKYLNSRDTPLFDKGRTLYALDKARGAVAGGPARPPEELIIVEGYMDVIALHRAGFTGAVAPLGTALTEEQIKAVWKLANEPILCFDGDPAGQRAAQRAATRALPILMPGHSLRFVTLPKGEDPDSLIRKFGGFAFREILGTFSPLVEVVWESVVGGATIDTPERRASLEKKIEDQIRLIADRTVQFQYRRHLRSKLWSILFSEATGRRLVRKPIGMRFAGDLTHAKFHHQRLLIATVLNNLDVFAEVVEELLKLDLGRAEYNRITRELVEAFARDPDLDRDHLMRLLAGRQIDVSEFLNPELYALGRFAAPNPNFEETLGKWRMTYRGLQLRALTRELQLATADYQKAPSPEKLEEIEKKVQVLQLLQRDPDTQEYLGMCEVVDLESAA